MESYKSLRKYDYAPFSKGETLAWLRKSFTLSLSLLTAMYICYKQQSNMTN